MEKINKVLDFYVLTNCLKDKIRSGVAIWHISKDRLESVAEHIYGTCMLAIALDSEYDFNIDIKKSIIMLTIHELEECYIGDLTPLDNITRVEKIEKGEQAVSEILSGLVKKEEYLELTKEYDLIFIDASKGNNKYFFEKFKNNLSNNGIIITDNLSFHGLVEDESKAVTKNQKGLVKRIKKFINFLDELEDFETVYVDVGDKISISKKVR